MKFVLFCQNAYSFEIMRPFMKVLKDQGDSYLWFITPKLAELFPFKDEPVTQSIQELESFESDAIICPGNEVPYYLRGLKVQIFHGLAGEKKGHFRIRHYFDLYLTQGPYFTDGFNKLKAKYKNFDVIETGWSKLDAYAHHTDDVAKLKQEILDTHNASSILLYAPTFSPSLTSAKVAFDEIEKLAQNNNYVIHIKFHDLMDAAFIASYKQLAKKYDNVYFKDDRNILTQFQLADVLISDTSSVIYEFMLLNKPVITIGSISENIQWKNITDPTLLMDAVEKTISNDPFIKERAAIIAAYHPYNDGKSTDRMVAAIKETIKKKGVPQRRKLSLLRRMKINKIFNRKS